VLLPEEQPNKGDSLPQYVELLNAYPSFLRVCCLPVSASFRPSTEAPKHSNADRSNSGAQIERVLYRGRFLQSIPCGRGVIDPVAVSTIPLENSVRPNQTRDKKSLAHLLLKRRESRNETLMNC
jgi:hypothetical protein